MRRPRAQRRVSIGGVVTGVILALASASSAAPLPFVRVEGTRFFLGDEPFYFVGANLNVMHGQRPRRLAERTFAAAAADGLRVGRIWALGEGLPSAPQWSVRHFLFRRGPKGWNEAAFRQLDRVLALAAKYGIRLIVTLSNRWKDYGGVPMYLRWAGHRDVEAYGYSDRFFTDRRIKAWFLDHVERIVNRRNTITNRLYRDDPSIFAWEVQNEMGGTPEAAQARRIFFVDVARRIRRWDPRHLIVPGLIGYNLQKERVQWVAMCKLPEADFCDQHIYPQEHLRSRSPRNLRAFIDDRVQLAHYVVGKPIVFGEFGFADGRHRRRRALLHRRFLSRVYFDGGNGALVWIYQPTLSWRRRYGVLIDQPRYRLLRRTLARQARRFRRRWPRLRNPRLGPAVGMRPIAPTHAMIVRRRRPFRRWQSAPRHPTRTWGRPIPRGHQRLQIPVDGFYRAFFEEAGFWDGGVLVHAYGRRTGWIAYRFVGPRFLPRRMTLRLRLSSEFPGHAAPKAGRSRVEVRLAGVEVAQLDVRPDDGIGQWYEIAVDNTAVLRRLVGRRVELRLTVRAGERANGVAIYGRETAINREPVDAPGPIEILAAR